MLVKDWPGVTVTQREAEMVPRSEPYCVLKVQMAGMLQGQRIGELLAASRCRLSIGRQFESSQRPAEMGRIATFTLTTQFASQAAGQNSRNRTFA